jgi:biotin transport system substrate-specific component
MGSTGGYLVAFPAAAFITGAFAEHGWDRRFFSAAAAMAIGSIVIIVCGSSWYALLTHSRILTVFIAIVLPIIPGDIIKILLAAAVLPSGWKLVRKQ